MLCLLTQQAYSGTAYIKSEDGTYILYPDSAWKNQSLPNLGDYKPTSIGYIPTKLGYLENEWYLYISEQAFVVFKAFSTDIICIIYDTDNQDSVLTQSQINELLEDFDYNRTFKIEQALNGEIRQSFMEKTLNKKAINNSIVDEVNGYTYTFSNGMLSSWFANDGIQGFAKEYKGSKLYNIIESNAKRKHQSRDEIVEEINFQFVCFANMRPAHLKLATSRKYNYNMALVWFSIYGIGDEKATLDNFLLCVPDAEPMDVSDKSITLSWGTNLFKFRDGMLVKVL